MTVIKRRIKKYKHDDDTIIQIFCYSRSNIYIISLRTNTKRKIVLDSKGQVISDSASIRELNSKNHLASLV
jgi:hypothetical protein